MSLGIEKIRLTGGEPLIRKDVPNLVEQLARLKPHLRDLALTTNGFDFLRHARNLKDAGLDRVTLSLDSLRAERFFEITKVDALDKVFAAIETAKEVGFDPVKINACVVRGCNDDEVVDFARFARDAGISMRFIEFMPLDSGHEWSREMVVPGKEIYEKINEVFPLKLIETSRGTGTAWKYAFADRARVRYGISCRNPNVLRSMFTDPPLPLTARSGHACFQPPSTICVISSEAERAARK